GGPRSSASKTIATRVICALHQPAGYRGPGLGLSAWRFRSRRGWRRPPKWLTTSPPPFRATPASLTETRGRPRTCSQSARWRLTCGTSWATPGWPIAPSVRPWPPGWSSRERDMDENGAVSPVRTRVGLVDGSVQASTRRFTVVLDEDAVVQLDELVATSQELPDGRELTHYGIVVEGTSAIEGAELASDTQRIAHARTMPGVTAR